MIEVDGLVARSSCAPRVAVGPVSFGVEPGAAVALLGKAVDGVDALLDAVAGVIPARRGKVTIAGRPPGPSRSVAYVPFVPVLPEVLRVEDYLRTAASLRGEAGAPPEDRLEVLGVAPLLRRSIGGLSLEQARTVALVEAVTSAAEVLLLADPLADLDPRAAGRIGPAILERVAQGATVLCSTASAEDAAVVGRDVLVFERGQLVQRSSDRESWSPPVGPGGARLLVRSEGARYLLAELASDPTFREVVGAGADLVTTGTDPVAMASAVVVAARRAGVELDSMRFVLTGGADT
jgi:ABC-type multidrug transport system ATPase subunit